METRPKIRFNEEIYENAETRPKVEEVRYFWTDWFRGQSYRTLALVYALLSFADLIATVRMRSEGVQEGNALAKFFLQQFGDSGLIIYKVLLVAVVLLTTWCVQRANPRLAAIVLWAGIVSMGFVMARHLAVFVAAGISSM